ncbi:MAG: sulfatase-like hydrolase/transferase [Haloarculaceae archaeon]
MATPNVVWIAMEDVSPRFGYSGDDVARTPRIDALAGEGRRYPNTFCTAPVCAPSRSAVMTGCHGNAIGTHHMRTDTHDREGLPDSYDAVPPHYVTAITEYFRRAGYFCTLDAKTDYQFGEPFTMWDRHGDGAGWWNDARDGEQPFFAMFTNGVTHESGMWDPDAPWSDQQFGGAPDPPETDPDAVEVPPYLPDTDATRESIARHYDNLAAADAWVGDLLDRLAADGHAEDTIVALWSDHGEGLPRCKRWPYDSGTNVPLIVRWPGEFDGGDVDDRLVSLHDLGPTMLEMCGLDVPPYVDGRPFYGKEATERDYVVSTRDRYDEEYDMVRSVRGERYRYVRHYRPGRPYRQWIPYRNRHPAMQELLERAASGDLEGARQWFDADRPAEELYDLAADPHETENLAADPAHADALERLRAALDEWRERVDDVGDVAEREMVHARYEGGDQPVTATPVFVPNAPGNREREPVSGTVAFDGPATLSLYCATQGASVAYALGDGEDAGETDWRLYTGPIDLPEGETTVRAKAVRYGYAESDATSVTVTVSG